MLLSLHVPKSSFFFFEKCAREVIWRKYPTDFSDSAFLSRFTIILTEYDF